MASTIYRVEKNKNYTAISNYHLQDKNLSLKAKGLLTLVLSLPPEPDWTINLDGLQTLSKDGVDSVRTALNELEKNGYLIRSRGRRLDGTLESVQYTFLEVPETVQGYNYLPPPPFKKDDKKGVQMGISDINNAADW